MKNEMYLEIAALSHNEGLARIAIVSFMSCLNPNMEEIEDVKTAVSEAVTNCIIHGYGNDDDDEMNLHKKIYISCNIENKTLEIQIKDEGVGIVDIKKAMEPLYTSKPELERSGMGFSFMEAFMDQLIVKSKVNEGTTIIMQKEIGMIKKESSL